MANVTKELVLNETFMSTEQTPRNVADILADELENIASAIEGGSGSGGHIIQDASGTDLAQEAKLQFGGMLKTTDDSENGVTKVSDLAEEIDWSVWNAMTEAQRTAYSVGKKLDIINVPSVSGSIPVELIKTLWTNSDPTASFAPQNITLASDDYDFLYVVCMMSTSISREITSLIEAENTGFITTTFAATGGINMYQRTIQYTSKTVLSITDAYKITNGAYGGVDNTIIIPVAIYGLKSSVNVDMSALVANVSTSASKCMLSDGETSVEDAIEASSSKTDIAAVESGSTASRAYSVGELVYVNGNLYKVITAIASGATFTVNTNIQSANVSDRAKEVADSVSALGTKLTPQALYDGDVSFTTGQGWLANSAFNKAHFMPMTAQCVGAAAPCMVSLDNAGAGVFVTLPLSTGFTGTLRVIIYGVGWN